MQRGRETFSLILLPIIIVGMIIYNAGLMSRIYVTGNGLDQAGKIYKAKILPDKYDVTIENGEGINLDVELVNQGSFVWTHQTVNLSYHILDRDKQMLVYDNERYQLPEDIPPDSEARTKILIVPQLPAGDYLLEFDLVEEGVAWFGTQGSPTALVKVHVK